MADLLDPAAGPTADAPRTPPCVPDHKMIRPIGRGSSGEVWLASNILGTFRAVKVIYASTFRHRRPFEREFTGILRAEPISRLHEGLVDILQVGRNDEQQYFYYVMELADDARTGSLISPDTYSSRTLTHDMSIRKRLPVEECVLLGASIASALRFLHQNGLTHRDIKPSNIIFVNGAPKLADIGLVEEFSEAKAYVGTEGFIPPEGPGTPQADIYSLGKVLYEVSTGKDRNDYPALPTEFEETAADRRLLRFNKIVFRACRADPYRRFKSADEMMSTLLAFDATDKVEANRERTNSWLRKVAIVGSIIGVVVLVLLVRRLMWLLKHGG